MDYKQREQAFQSFIYQCEKTKQYIGLGNPFANILLIGQEPSGNEIARNIRDVKTCFENKDLDKLYRQPKRDENGNRFSAGHTWNKYQKLINLVYNRECQESDMTDFGEIAFVTDINNSVSKTKELTKDSAKVLESVRKRLLLFQQSEFIQDFPVVVLACGDYIKNDDKTRQIDETFDVKFVGENREVKSKSGKSTFPFWLHYNDDKTRLVIHTRQLSGRIPNTLLEELAKVIKKHLEEHNKMALFLTPKENIHNA